MRPLLSVLLGLSALSPAQTTQTVTGIISDSECAEAGHTAMRMGSTDAECVAACIDAHGASYVLVAGEAVYALSDQKSPATFAARRVSVTGRLDPKTKTIVVASIVAAD
jgi:streptogramin lyase